MPHSPSRARILVSGGCGFLGRYLVAVLRSECEVLSFDVKNSSRDENFVEGSVTDATMIETAMAGVTGIVIGHMAPRFPGVYDSPQIPFDINVKGTALLFDAAVRHRIKRVVLISSISAVDRHRKSGTFLSTDLPLSADTIYGLTKVQQEEIARFYHENHGLEVAMLRPAYISLGDTLEDKYGVRRPSVNWSFIDPRDIGTAALAALKLDDLGCEAFYLMAGPHAEEKADIRHTMTRLNWQPRYRFTEFPHD